MSHVAGVVLVFKTDGREDEDVLADVNKFFAQSGLVDVTRAGGGSKHPQLQVAIGGFNYLDIPAFLAHLRAVDWGGGYGWADVAIQDEDDNGAGWIHVFRGPTADDVGAPFSEGKT